MSTEQNYTFVDGVLVMRHRYWFGNRGWLTCECGKPLKDEGGRGVRMPEGVGVADDLFARHATNQSDGSE